MGFYAVPVEAWFFAGTGGFAGGMVFRSTKLRRILRDSRPPFSGLLSFFMKEMARILTLNSTSASSHIPFIVNKNDERDDLCFLENELLGADCSRDG